jgi:hypothetical protein
MPQVQAPDQGGDAGHDHQAQAEIVVAGVEADAGDVGARDVADAVGAVGEADPVDQHDGQDLLEADGDHADVVAAELEAGGAEQEAAGAGDGDADQEGGEEVEAEIDRAERDAIGADAEEGGLGDRDLAAIAEHDDEADHGDAVGDRLHDDVEKIALRRQEVRRGDGDQDGDGQARRAAPWPCVQQVHAFSAIFSPNRPCGRTSRKNSSSRKAKASL